MTEALKDIVAMQRRLIGVVGKDWWEAYKALPFEERRRRCEEARAAIEAKGGEGS